MPGLRIAMALLAGVGPRLVVPAPAAAVGSYSPYAETAAGALARYVRTLASRPKDFSALVGAGRAALALGDTQAAAGFFARADVRRARDVASRPQVIHRRNTALCGELKVTSHLA